jgi:hypothetical protein
MGEIAPEERTFRFTRETDIDGETTRLAKLLRKDGVVYAESIASYDALLPLLQKRIPMLGGYPQSTACCLYLMGRESEARSFVKEFLDQTQHPRLQDFAVSFLEFVEQEHRSEAKQDE